MLWYEGKTSYKNFFQKLLKMDVMGKIMQNLTNYFNKNVVIKSDLYIQNTAFDVCF